METEIINKEAFEAAKADSSKIVNHAKELAVAIKDSDTLQVAVDFCLHIRRKRKEWENYNADEKEKIKALRKSFDDRVRQIDEPMERAEIEILKPAIGSYQNEQERKRREAEAVMMAQRRKAEEDARLAHAAALEKAGAKEEAEQILEAPMPVAPVIIPKEKVEGGSFRTLWDFEITDEKLIPLQFMIPNLVAIRKHVQSFKEQAEMPGIKVFSKQILSSGRY